MATHFSIGLPGAFWAMLALIADTIVCAGCEFGTHRCELCSSAAHAFGSAAHASCICHLFSTARCHTVSPGRCPLHIWLRPAHGILNFDRAYNLAPYSTRFFESAAKTRICHGLSGIHMNEQKNTKNTKTQKNTKHKEHTTKKQKKQKKTKPQRAGDL